MTRLWWLVRCLGFHDWKRMKHGPDLSPYPDWDARECRRCLRFEVVVYGNWREVRDYVPFNLRDRPDPSDSAGA